MHGLLCQIIKAMFIKNGFLTGYVYLKLLVDLYSSSGCVTDQMLFSKELFSNRYSQTEKRIIVHLKF